MARGNYRRLGPAPPPPEAATFIASTALGGDLPLSFSNNEQQAGPALKAPDHRPSGDL